jgi:hypothetical protein
MISWLLLGFAMGVRHALEADHLAAVASLSARTAGPRDLWRVAAAWGAGHALTIVLLALLWVSTGVKLPDGAQPLAEAGAGFLLIWLGFDLLRRRDGGWARFHPHQHRDGTRHLHLHWDAPHAASAGACTPHPHVDHPLRRALVVGSVHGLAGSALLGILATSGALPARAISYALVFGLGAMTGMLLLSTAVSFPLRLARVRAIASGRWCRRAIASGSIALGVWISAEAILPLTALELGIRALS